MRAVVCTHAELEVAERPEPVPADGQVRIRRGRQALFSRVVVVGVCVGVDQITPAMAVNKEIDLRFVFGCTPLEFRDTAVEPVAPGRS